MIQKRLHDKEKEIQDLKKQSSSLLNRAWEKGYVAGLDDGYETGKQSVCGNNPKWCENCVSKGKCASTRPTGEWIEGKNGNIKCNQCGCEIRYSYLIGNKPDFPKFCCDCGAKMRKEIEE